VLHTVATIGIPIVQIALVEGGRVIRLEAFNLNQRNLALARFEELSVKSQRPGSSVTFLL
jgi:hypothetical protein